MKKSNKIIFVIEQKGGMDGLSPLVQKFIEEGREVLLILCNKKIEKPRIKGLKTYFVKQNISLQKIEGLFHLENPEAVFTDTNDTIFEQSITKKSIRAARELKTPVFSFVDYWANYKGRFLAKPKFLPDYILVVDEHMKEDILKEFQMPLDRVVVTGNPRFQKLAKPQKQDETLAVFFSQPAGKNHTEGDVEVSALKELVKNIEKSTPVKKMIIKFHPTREKKTEKYDKIIKSSALKFEKSLKSDPLDLALKSGLVLGLNSTMLFEASLLGKKVLSYQPGKNRKTDTLMSNKIGLSEAAYTPKELARIVKKIYSKNNKKIKNNQINKYTKNDSINKIINLMKKNKQKKDIICVVQARTGSSRLPKKVLFDLEGKAVLLRVVDRLLLSEKIDHIIVATTTKRRDDAIAKLAQHYHPKVSVFRGSEDDVLDRFYKAVKNFKPSGVIRITADCPLIDPEIVDKVVNDFLKFKVDYVSNTLGVRTYPRGLDAEIFSFDLLEELWKETLWETDREHVTLFARRSPTLFSCRSVLNDKDYSVYRWTLDEASDYKLIKIIYKKLFRKNYNFKMKDVINLFEKSPELIKINENVEQKDPHF